MRTLPFLFALLLVSLPVLGQEKVSVKGRILNQQGEAVEYVQVGIPKLQLGTISSADGFFEIAALAKAKRRRAEASAFLRFVTSA